MMMNRLIVPVLLAAACGGKQPTPTPTNQGSGTQDPPGVVADTRSEIEKRRDAACDKLGPRMTECALEEAQAEHAAGRLSKADLDAISKPEIREKNTADFLKACKVPMSTHQVRVLEVCPEEEKTCGPMLSCLEHLNDKPATK